MQSSLNPLIIGSMIITFETPEDIDAEIERS